MEIIEIGKIPKNEAIQKYVKSGTIPIRFCYPDEGGDIWHNLRSDNAYELGNMREWVAYTEGLKKAKQTVGSKSTNIIHLGVGDGIEIPELFRYFKPVDGAIYAGVDISKRMIENTLALRADELLGADASWYLTDIETEGNLKSVCYDVRNRGENGNLVLLNNQGVLLSNPKTLQNIYAAMQKQDRLFITVEGDDREKRTEICASYDLPDCRALLSLGLKRAGIDPKDGAFRTVFNEEKSRAEVYFTPNEGNDILCLTSYKPKEFEFRKRLDRCGFGIDFLEFYPEVHTFAVLCHKKEV